MISQVACNSQIYAPALAFRTPEERRIIRIAELTRAIAVAQKDAEHYHNIGNEKGEQICKDFIRRKVAERDALLTPPIVAQNSQDVTND